MARAAAAESEPLKLFVADKVRATFDMYLASADPTFFVLEHRRELCGFMVARLREFTFCAGLFTVQEVLYVRPDKRGTRAAATLISELIRWSEGLGAVEVHGGNENAIRTQQMTKFLGRFGFEHVGHIMRKGL